jgi:3-hydroxy-9,10-secoandrosta-1,3,5(10)-triene-9,17-dione monooxygenase reductase component
MVSDQGKEFRAALGSFATGVTIVTTKGLSGMPVGVTASSFNSVSLDPPLILWSLAKSSRSHDDFCSSGHFAVHVLAADQRDFSDRFARSGEDKFSGLDWREGETGSPLFEQFAARFECRTHHVYEGGDHIILVGEVVAFDKTDTAPLLFHGGRYAEKHEPVVPVASQEHPEAGDALFSNHFIFHLIGRAYFQVSAPNRAKLAELGISQEQFMFLARLSIETTVSRAQLMEQSGRWDVALSPQSLAGMVDAGLIVLGDSGYTMSARGRQIFVEMLSIAKAFEEDLMANFTVSQAATVKHFLQRLIELTATDLV